MAYTRAVEATGKALMAKKDAPEEARVKGGIAVLDALEKRIELDPKGFDALLATTDRMESENAGTRLATLGAFARYQQISDAPEEVLGTPAERLDRQFDALRRLSEVTPKFDKAAEFIRNLIDVAKGLGRYDKVEALYLLHVKEFPDDPYSAYAKGGAYLASLHGKTVDDFKGTDAVTGRPVDLKTLRGKVVIVDFWATWCAPCMKEMPELLEAHQRLGPLGFEIIGVNPRRHPPGGPGGRLGPGIDLASALRGESEGRAAELADGRQVRRHRHPAQAPFRPRRQARGDGARPGGDVPQALPARDRGEPGEEGGGGGRAGEAEGDEVNFFGKCSRVR